MALSTNMFVATKYTCQIYGNEKKQDWLIRVASHCILRLVTWSIKL